MATKPLHLAVRIRSIPEDMEAIVPSPLLQGSADKEGLGGLVDNHGFRLEGAAPGQDQHGQSCGNEQSGNGFSPVYHTGMRPLGSVFETSGFWRRSGGKGDDYPAGQPVRAWGGFDFSASEI